MIIELNDEERVMAMLQPFLPEPTVTITCLAVPGEPRSKARPRFDSRRGRQHAYADSKQLRAERSLKTILRRTFRRPFDGNLAIACIFFRSTKHRIDCDNMLKHVLDAANNVCWRDDYQVTAVMGIVELDPTNPRTVIAVAPHASTMFRGNSDLLSICATCNTAFTWRSYPSQDERVFCSRKCSSLTRGQDLTSPVTCLGCGKKFRRSNARQSLCSESCRVVQMNKAARNRRKHAAAFCENCRKPLSRPEYVRCRDCWREAVASLAK